MDIQVFIEQYISELELEGCVNIDGIDVCFDEEQKKLLDSIFKKYFKRLLLKLDFGNLFKFIGILPMKGIFEEIRKQTTFYHRSKGIFGVMFDVEKLPQIIFDAGGRLYESRADQHKHHIT